MTTHSLKIWPEPFQAVLDGRKTAEFRREMNDAGDQIERMFEVGDALLLREYDPEQKHPESGCQVGGYTGREQRVVVTHKVGSLFEETFGLPAGCVMLSIRVVEGGLPKRRCTCGRTSGESHEATCGKVSEGTVGRRRVLASAEDAIRAAVEEAFAEDLTGPGAREALKSSVVAYVLEAVRLRGQEQEGGDRSIPTRGIEPRRV